MKTIFSIFIISCLGIKAFAQCHYIPSTSTSLDTLSYNFSGGVFQSIGCAPVDPTYWLTGFGDSVTITFVNPESYPALRVWGMNNDDSASVSINGLSYPLDPSSATYDSKIVCGISPGPDGVIFYNGKLVGANSNAQGNYSYQNVQLIATNVSSITISSLSGAGWGFAGVSLNCPLITSLDPISSSKHKLLIYPNPFKTSVSIMFNSTILNGKLTIINQYGTTIKTIEGISGNEIYIDDANLPSGVYYIRLIQDDTQIALEKILIAK